MRSEQDINQTIEDHADTIKRICMLYLKSVHDTEDIFQNVFLKYALSSVDFTDEAHKKAWLIRVTINECKDLLKNFFRQKTVPIDTLFDLADERTAHSNELLEAVLSLPHKYRDVIYLHYYEGYTAIEIGSILKKNPHTVYTLLHRGRQRLRQILGGEDLDDTTANAL